MRISAFNSIFTFFFIKSRKTIKLEELKKNLKKIKKILNKKKNNKLLLKRKNRLVFQYNRFFFYQGYKLIF
jgi:hypothetical protein